MKITKLGHCCLIIEEKGVKILTDPGMNTTTQNNIKDIDVLLVTHEHMDHLDLSSLRSILENNSNIKIFTNKGVAKILDKEKIRYELLEHGQSRTIKGVSIEGFGREHAEMYPTLPRAVNTGYLIADRLFFPGDSFHLPKKPVDILALPTFGPWLKFSESIDFAKNVKPKFCFPVHDGMLELDIINKLIEKLLSPQNIKFVVPKAGEEIDI